MHSKCGGVAELAYAADLKSAAARLVGSSPTAPTRSGSGTIAALIWDPAVGLEPMRWISVEKTARWAVFRKSPEGFSPRGPGRRRRRGSPTAPTRSGSGTIAALIWDPAVGLEPMRWISVEKTARWAVFRKSPEGFSPRGPGRRRRRGSPTAPTRSGRTYLLSGSRKPEA